MTPLHHLSPCEVRQLFKTAAEPPPHESGDIPKVRMNKEVAKEMAKVLGVIGVSSGAGALAAHGTNHLLQKYKVLESVPARHLAMGGAAITTALPMLYAARHTLSMDRLREAYERGRTKKPEQPLSGGDGW